MVFTSCGCGTRYSIDDLRRQLAVCIFRIGFGCYPVNNIFIGVDSDEVGQVYNGQIIESTFHNLFTDEHKSEKSMVTMMSVVAMQKKIMLAGEQ